MTTTLRDVFTRRANQIGAADLDPPLDGGSGGLVYLCSTTR